jgi:quinol monooxygenase YgiN
MGVESFAVLEQWVDREQITAGGAEPVIFKTREAAKAYATQKMKSWPYRAEVVSQ